MNCENCNSDNANNYGSGRFCSEKCARSFSTKLNRHKINKKVSDALKGKISGSVPFKNGNDSRRRIFSEEERLIGKRIAAENRAKRYLNSKWDELPKLEKYRRILSEQNGLCLCGIDSWLGKSLVLEIDHIDGNHSNNNKENLRYLCPNCHSQTPTFRNRKRKHNVQDRYANMAIR